MIYNAVAISLPDRTRVWLVQLTLPSGGWTSKKNVLFMYQLPIFPKWVSSQLQIKGMHVHRFQSSHITDEIPVTGKSHGPKQRSNQMYTCTCTVTYTVYYHTVIIVQMRNVWTRPNKIISFYNQPINNNQPNIKSTHILVKKPSK